VFHDYELRRLTIEQDAAQRSRRSWRLIALMGDSNDGPDAGAGGWICGGACLLLNRAEGSGRRSAQYGSYGQRLWRKC